MLGFSGLSIPGFKSLPYHDLKSSSQEYVDVFMENMFLSVISFALKGWVAKAASVAAITLKVRLN